MEPHHLRESRRTHHQRNTNGLEKKQPGQTELTELGIHETKEHKVQHHN